MGTDIRYTYNEIEIDRSIEEVFNYIANPINIGYYNTKPLEEDNIEQVRLVLRDEGDMDEVIQENKIYQYKIKFREGDISTLYLNFIIKKVVVRSEINFALSFPRIDFFEDSTISEDAKESILFNFNVKNRATIRWEFIVKSNGRVLLKLMEFRKKQKVGFFKKMSNIMDQRRIQRINSNLLAYIKKEIEAT